MDKREILCVSEGALAPLPVGKLAWWGYFDQAKLALIFLLAKGSWPLEVKARRAMTREQLLNKLSKAWTTLQESYAGLPGALLLEPGVVDDWSVKDILAHVTTWEEEALKYLPLILEGDRPPRYSVQYGGIDAFNALRTEQKRSLALSDVLEHLAETHRQLVDYLGTVPEEQFTRETPFRHRLRLDTYSHYPLHARMIREWREQAEKVEGVGDV